MIEIPSSKEEKKNLFLQIPHHPSLWNGEEFKMGASPPPPSLPPSLPSGGQGEGGRGRGKGKGERIEIIAKMLLVMIFQY